MPTHQNSAITRTNLENPLLDLQLVVLKLKKDDKELKTKNRIFALILRIKKESVKIQNAAFKNLHYNDFTLLPELSPLSKYSFFIIYVNLQEYFLKFHATYITKYEQVWVYFPMRICIGLRSR